MIIAAVLSGKFLVPLTLATCTAVGGYLFWKEAAEKQVEWDKDE
jgi:hypothetical protein